VAEVFAADHPKSGPLIAWQVFALLKSQLCDPTGANMLSADGTCRLWRSQLSGCAACGRLLGLALQLAAAARDIRIAKRIAPDQTTGERCTA
jgi:hypothetical protein